MSSRQAFHIHLLLSDAREKGSRDELGGGRESKGGRVSGCRSAATQATGGAEYVCLSVFNDLQSLFSLIRRVIYDSKAHHASRSLIPTPLHRERSMEATRTVSHRFPSPSFLALFSRTARRLVCEMCVPIIMLRHS